VLSNLAQQLVVLIIASGELRPSPAIWPDRHLASSGKFLPGERAPLLASDFVGDPQSH
jgi:hypothetical protein